ncbi:hypothetical protein D3C87_364070 [compost metagenome]
MTTVFECETCGNVDDIHATQQNSVGYECGRCKHGEWHHQFVEEKYSFDRHGPALNKADPSNGDGWPSFS